MRSLRSRTQHDGAGSAWLLRICSFSQASLRRGRTFNHPITKAAFSGLLFLTQAKLPQADEVMRVGLPHTLARLFAELGEVVRAFAFRKLFFAGLDQALKGDSGFPKRARQDRFDYIIVQVFNVASAVALLLPKLEDHALPRPVGAGVSAVQTGLCACV